ncbi:hypothetical protein TD95_001119 [Thielaviopsis punctulata]|uniref:Carbohydrate kinase PfkB domain-containing protein n=1 Tax=Thielaviopsis punctulata TaxID=72032 RepID=A0A0F4ZA89_9PEZI|nr:hypothetical protein TD95_001119 [Thielaviopsis punctulata]
MSNFDIKESEASYQEPQDSNQSGPHVDFVTLGMFIIDEIEFPPPKPPVYDALGGAGAFAALGARIMSPPPQSKSVAWIVDQGSDFPESLTTLINSWDSGVLFRRDDSRLTTRGWNGYGNAEARAFKYTTPKKRLTGADLTPEMLQSRSFHMVCSPARCRELVAEITLLRKASSPPGSYAKPLFIWEPVPDLCTAQGLLELTRTLSCVDICSPNHAELASYMGGTGLDEDGDISTEAVERNCEQLLSSMPLQSFTLVVRAGHKGCYVANNGGRRSDATGKKTSKNKRKGLLTHGGLQHDTDMFALLSDLTLDDDGQIAREEIETDAGLSRWIPAVHTDSNKVVDPTGGGNCFLGGLAVALARGCGAEEAAIWGSVAASFAIEQVGVPLVSQADDGAEMWNGIKVKDRMREFKARCNT